MIIQQIKKGTPADKQLDDFVTKHDLLFHSKKWVESYPKKNLVHCAILNNNNEITGCFIYYIFKKLFFRFVISPPYTPDIALFYVNPARSVVGKNSFEKELMTALASYFKSLNAHYLDINLPEVIKDTQPFTWIGFSAISRYTYLLDLSQSENELWNNLSPEKRKSINRAIKDELVITASTDGALLYNLIAQSLEKNDALKNIHIIKNILSFEKEKCIAFVAWKGDVPMAASFSVVSGKKAIYLFGGTGSESRHHGAGVSCMWQSILKAKELGLDYFDFEGSMNPNIERYFREFGGELTGYHSIGKVNPFLKMLLKFKRHQS